MSLPQRNSDAIVVVTGASAGIGTELVLCCCAVLATCPPSVS